MKKVTKNELKKKKGVTLIALTTTIIILMMLAGVSVDFLLGDNGIINRANDAETRTDEAKNEEEKILAETEKYIETAEKNGRMVTIKAENTNLRSVETFLEDEGLKALYGKDVDYTSLDGIVWQLFLDDIDNIYLIAKDFVPNEKLPVEENGGFLKKSKSPTNQQALYSASFSVWNPSSNKEEGEIVENLPWREGKNSTTIKLNPLTSKYLKWVGSGQDTIPDKLSMRAVAYMMDITQWHSFAGEAKGAFAIGGPTLEMFVKSYNAVDSHTTKLGTYETIDETNANENGYKVKVGTDEWTDKGMGLDMSDNNMWIRKDPERMRATGYYMASPSSEMDVRIRAVSAYGYLHFDSIGCQTRAFRPIVCIPKTSLQ